MEALGGGNRLGTIHNWLFSLKMSGREVTQLQMQQPFIFRKESEVITVYSGFWLGCVNQHYSTHLFITNYNIFSHQVQIYHQISKSDKRGNLPVQCEEVALIIQDGAASGD